MIIRFLFFFLLISFCSCQSKDSERQTLHYKDFELTTPSNWQKIQEQGGEDYIGGLTNGIDTLWFLYGPYIPGPTEKEASKHLYGQDTINGYSVVVLLPKKDSTGVMQLFIPSVIDGKRFAISGYGVKDKETVLQIFRSLTFKDSDPARNGTFKQSKFKEYPFGSGYTLYQAYCTTCHPRDKVIDGPRIEDLIQDRDPSWIHTFLTNRQAVASDSIHQARLKLYNIQCMLYDNLSIHDVKQIVGYIKGE